MADVIIHGWEKPYTCIECPFRIREEWNMEYGIKIPVFACYFALHEDRKDDEDVGPWIDVRKFAEEKFHDRLYDKCPLEEVKQ